MKYFLASMLLLVWQTENRVSCWLSLPQYNCGLLAWLYTFYQYAQAPSPLHSGMWHSSLFKRAKVSIPRVKTHLEKELRKIPYIPNLLLKKLWGKIKLSAQWLFCPICLVQVSNLLSQTQKGKEWLSNIKNKRMCKSLKTVPVECQTFEFYSVEQFRISHLKRIFA